MTMARMTDRIALVCISAALWLLALPARLFAQFGSDGGTLVFYSDVRLSETGALRGFLTYLEGTCGELAIGVCGVLGVFCTAAGGWTKNKRLRWAALVLFLATIAIFLLRGMAGIFFSDAGMR